MGEMIVYAVITLVSSAYQIKQQEKMKKKMEAAAEARKGQKFTVSGTSAPLPVVYGKQRLGGIHCSYKVSSSYPSVTENADEVLFTEFGSGAQSGSKNEFLGVQTALCHGGIESVKHILVNEIDYRGYTKEMKENKSSFNHRFLIHKDGGTADASATAFGFPNTNKFTGCAYVNNFFKLNRDEPQYSGIPSMAYIVKGRKVRAITRSGSSPNYTYSLNSSYTYSNNPALCLLDYLLNDDFGRGLTANDVDLESFYNAADICDTPVLTGATIGGEVNDVKPIFSYTSQADFPTTEIEPYMAGYLYYDETNDNLYTQTQSGSAPNITASYTLTTAPATDTIPLYECNITLSTEETIRNNIERILNTMGLSDLVWTPQGKYKLILSYPQTQAQQDALVTHTFNEDNIVRESVKLVFPKAQDRFNQVTVSFDNEFENFKDDTFTWPPTNSSVHQTYLSEDNNQPLTTSLQGDGVTSKYHAQALAEQQVRKSRALYTLNFSVNKEGLTVEPGDLIKVSMPTMSITNELYRVESIKVNTDFSVEISAYKFDFSVLAWNVPNDLDYIVKPNFDFKVEPPTSGTFTLDSSNNIGTASGKLNWVAANDASVNEYIIEISPDNGLNYYELGKTFNTSFDITGLKTGVYDFSIRSRNITGLLSERVIVENKTIQLKTVEKVAVIYANNNNLATNTQSYTKGSNEFVAFKNYDSDLPTLPIRSGLTFSRFVGISIGSISKSGDDVTINYTDGTTDTFIVNGVASVNKVNGVLTITYDDGSTSTLTDGTDGNGINSVTKSGTTVTVTYDDSTTNTFTVEDGVDSIQGDPDYVTVSNISKTGSGSYSANHIDVDFTFNQAGTVVAKRRYRVARSSNTWDSTITTRDGDIADETNVSRLTPSISISGTSALLTVTYSHSGVTSVASAPLNIIADGVGISSVSKTNQTVTVTYDDSSTDTFTVNGVSNVSKVGNQLTITYDDGTTSTIDDGIDGDDGNGIASVSKSGTTVTVTYDDSTTNTFTVEDGVDAIYADPDPVTTFSITKDQEAGTYSANHIDVDFEFRQGSTTVAKRRYRLARSADSWGTLTTRDADISDELNVSRLSASKNVSGQNATILVTYSHNNITSIGSATLNIILNNNKGDPGVNGARGAGWWRYETGNTNSVTGLSNTVLNSYFSTATGLSVTAADRLIVVNSNDEAVGYLRNNANNGWTEQAEFIDGSLLVNGTVTADAIQGSTITSDKLNSTEISTFGMTIGTLSSAATGERLVLKDNKIQVFDANNVARVTIGLL
jgi:hypothetical protein